MTADTNEVVINHENLGKVRGIHSESGVNQFLGIKYGTISERFSDAEEFSQKDVDATKLGPMAPQNPDSCTIELSIIQHDLGVDLSKHLPSQDEFECLNLNVYVPENASNDLPVFVWVHGGAFKLGANSYPQFDLKEFVKLSNDIGTPVIGVAINYRLGAFASLTSSDLIPLGITGNHQLKDSALAFKWVKKHISGFGGDSNNITAIGQSAGSSLVISLLNYEEPLFDRAIAMSGHPLLLQPVPIQVQDQLYQLSQNLTNINAGDVKEQLTKLRSLSTTEIFKSLESVPTTLTRDSTTKWSSSDEFFNETNFNLPGKKWCKSLLIGDSKHDSNILSLFLGSRTKDISISFIKHVNEYFKTSPEISSSIIKNLGISEDTPDAEALEPILDFLGNIVFYLPAINSAEGWSNSSSFVYNFEIQNPWDGPLKSKSNHIFDAAVLFQNFKRFLPEELQNVGQLLAGKFIQFINGKNPWDEYKENKGVFVVNDKGGEIISRANVNRDSSVDKLANNIGYDKLNVLALTFIFK